MDVKTYLRQIQRYDKKVQYKLSELYRLKALSTSISAGANDDVRVQSSNSGGRLENSVIRIVALENEIDKLVMAYLSFNREIIDQIESMDDMNEYAVLYERYVEYKSFDEIASDLGYSRRQIDRLHGNALAHFEKKFTAELMNMS